MSKGQRKRERVRAVNVRGVLHRNPERVLPRPVREHKADHPDAVAVGTTPLAPPARDVLSPDEYEARIADYAARMERGESLPLFGQVDRTEYPPEPEPGFELQCWGCSAIRRREGSKAAGWVGRRMEGYSVTEIYCRGCFGVWGWPDEYRARCSMYGAGLIEPGWSGDEVDVEADEPEPAPVPRCTGAKRQLAIPGMEG